MSENPYAHPAPGDDVLTTEGPERTSVLAIMSFVFSLLCCIPGLGVVGALMGILAILMIGGSSRVKGRGFAIAGLVLGLLTTVVWIGIAVAVSAGLGKFGIYAESVEHVASRDLAQAEVYFTDSEGVLTQEMVDAFAQALQDDWGAYVSGPTSIAEWFEGWSGSGQQMQALMEAAQLEYGGQGAMPIPVNMEKGSCSIVFIMDIQRAETENIDGLPKLRNIGFVRNDGTMMWLLDPDA